MYIFNERWKMMSYKEICDEINNIEWIDPYIGKI